MSRSRRWLSFRFQRLHIQIRKILSLLISRDGYLIPLVLLIGIALLLIFIGQFQLGPTRTAILQTVLSVLEIAFGVYISFGLLLSELRPPAKDRIDRPESVVSFYEERGCADDFIAMTDIGGWDDATPLDTVPGIVESIPEKPVPVSELEATVDTEQFYPLPERVQRLYEPVIDTLHEDFVDEGNFNQMKLRPHSLDGTDFAYGTTTFFNNYATNLTPDYDLFNSRSARELFHSEVFRPDDSLRPLTGSESTKLPYIAASAGMIIGRDGKAVFPIRSRDVIIEGLNLGLSFGGSWDLDKVSADGIDGQIESELSEERKLVADHPIDIHYIGTLRRLELLGKPDCFLVGVVDGVPDWKVSSSEETGIVVEQVIPEDVTVDGIETVLAHANTVTRRVRRLINESAYPPGVGLLYWLYLLNCMAENIDETSRGS